MTIEMQTVDVAAFEAFIASPAHQDRLFELVNGEIVEKMPTREHGIIAGKIITKLNNYLDQNPIGVAAVEARHRPENDTRNDRIPDVSVVTDMTRPIETQGAALYMPNLCVEIKSPDDTSKMMHEKAAFYLASGAQIVWLVYPEKRLVEVHTSDDWEVFDVEDTLSGGDVLPGFSVRVRDIFPA